MDGYECFTMNQLLLHRGCIEYQINIFIVNPKQFLSLGIILKNECYIFQLNDELKFIASYDFKKHT